MPEYLDKVILLETLIEMHFRKCIQNRLHVVK